MATIEKFGAPGVFEPATYSQGIRVTQAQTILFLSGQVAYTPDGGVACRGDFKGQARGAYEAIKALVESQGGTLANVIKITTYVTDMSYRVDLAPVREEFHRILKDTKLWNGRTAAFQVTDFTERAMQLRAIMSASNSSAAFDLRCLVRERLIAFLQQNYPESLPLNRAQLNVHDRETSLFQK